MDWAQVVSFAFVVALLVMSPGPNGVLIAKTVPASGRAAGFANIAGFVSAFYLHGSLSIFGLSVILVHSSTAFLAVKLCGAAYLFWMGIKALISAYKGVTAEAGIAPSERRRQGLAAFTEGFLTNALNPKVAMFYLAVFPQFIPHDAGGGAVLATAYSLVLLHSLINMVWFGAMVMLLGRFGNAARNPSFQRWLKGVTGAVFIAFGVKLALHRAG